MQTRFVPRLCSAATKNNPKRRKKNQHLPVLASQKNAVESAPKLRTVLQSVYFVGAWMSWSVGNGELCWWCCSRLRCGGWVCEVVGALCSCVTRDKLDTRRQTG